MAEEKKEEVKKPENDYTYRFEELVDEIEKSIKKVEGMLNDNSYVRIKLVEKGLDEDEKFKRIIDTMKEQYDALQDQHNRLVEKLELGKKYLKISKGNKELNKNVALLMDLLGVFKK